MTWGNATDNACFRFWHVDSASQNERRKERVHLWLDILFMLDVRFAVD